MDNVTIAQARNTQTTVQSSNSITASGNFQVDGNAGQRDQTQNQALLLLSSPLVEQIEDNNESTSGNTGAENTTSGNPATSSDTVEVSPPSIAAPQPPSITAVTTDPPVIPPPPPAEDQILVGTAGNDNLTGGAGNDELFGFEGDNTLSGGAGNDYFRAGTGNDQMDGGAGNDWFIYEGGNDTINGGPATNFGDRDLVQITTGTFDDFDYAFGENGSAVLTHKNTGETLTLTNVDQVIFGNGETASDPFEVFGQLLPIVEPEPPVEPPQPPQPPNNIGFGDQSPIQVTNNSGTVTLSNDDATATYSDAFMQEKLEEFKNSDQYPSLQTRDLVTTDWGYSGSGSALTAFLNYVIDTYPEGDPSLVTPPAEDQILVGTAGNDTITGGAGNDELFGFEGDNTLSGGAGNDYFRAGTGNDQMDGGAGNDWFIYEGGNDTINGGPATNFGDRDLVQITTGTFDDFDYAFGENGSAVLTHKNTGETLTLTNVDQVIFGNGETASDPFEVFGQLLPIE